LETRLIFKDCCAITHTRFQATSDGIELHFIARKILIQCNFGELRAAYNTLDTLDRTTGSTGGITGTVGVRHRIRDAVTPVATFNEIHGSTLVRLNGLRSRELKVGMHSLRGTCQTLLFKNGIERRQAERDKHRQHNQYDK
jgi:hypothetical protein